MTDQPKLYPQNHGDFLQRQTDRIATALSAQPPWFGTPWPRYLEWIYMGGKDAEIRELRKS